MQLSEDSQIGAFLFGLVRRFEFASGEDGDGAMSRLNRVRVEIMLSSLDHRFVGVHFAVGQVQVGGGVMRRRVGVHVARLAQEAVFLSAQRMKKVSAHSRVALKTNAGSRHSHVLA